jgi:class 3 adenylate cyclase/tetratricopeptide (TPR) repeat protein
VATGRLRRVIESQLNAAERAIGGQDWARALELCEDVLAVEPDNHDASVLRSLAERHVGRTAADAGRRHVTVLYLDLAGSTAMGEQLDPEIYHDLILGYEQACRPVIDHYGGHVHRYAGDGIIVFFGYPNAHEDDARRATLTGLEALSALREVSDRATLEYGVAVRARAGVHAGPAVLGSRGSAGWPGRDDAFGPTVNMAARLQTLAAPGTVVVSDTVALLLGPSVVLASQGEKHLAGVPRPVEVFDVVGPVEGADARATTRTELVGRRDELGGLLGRVERARTDPTGPGRAVLLRGEAGVGKSRLLTEMLERVDTGGGLHHLLHCSMHLSTSSLHPIRSALERNAAIVGEDPAEVRLGKLVRLVERLELDPAALVPHLALTLSIEVAGRFDAIELDPSQLKEAQLAAVEAVIRRLTAINPPYVFAVEDVQWADPMTAELLERLVVAGPPRGLVLVLTSRPSSSWPAAALPVDVVDVGPLPAADVRRLAVATAGGPLAEDVLDQVEERSDGVPFYVTQLVDTLAARGHDTAPGDIPVSLMGLLQSRLDSVGRSAKAVAQVAATIGREFELSLLRSVVLALAGNGNGDGDGDGHIGTGAAGTADSDGTGDSADEHDDGAALRAGTVDGHVDRLVSSHLVDVDPEEPERLRFHHALVCDAAYQSQLLRLRPARHLAVAEVLAELDESGRPVDATLTARHFREGGDPVRAVTAYVAGAKRAVRAGAFVEAMSHLTEADALLAGVAALGGAQTVQAELTVHLLRGTVRTNLGGWAAEGVMEDYARALELCAKASGDSEAGHDSLGSLIGIWSWYCTTGDLVRVAEAGEALDRQLGRTPMDGGMPVLASCQGVEHFYAGRFEAARRMLEACVAGFRTDDIVDWTRWQGANDPMAAAYAFLAPLRYLMGDEPAALAAVEAGLERSAGLGFPIGPFSEAFVRAYEAWLHRLRGAPEAALAACDELVRVAGKHGFQFWQVVALLQTGATMVQVEGSPATIDRLDSAITVYRTYGAHALVPSLLLEQAEGCMRAGALDEAQRCVDDALSYDVQRYARAEGLRLRAELRAARGGAGTADAAEDRAAVAADLREAHDVAVAQPAPHLVNLVAESHRRLVGGERLGAG